MATFTRITEQDSKYRQLQDMSVIEVLTNINKEDQTVPHAVAAAINDIEKVVQYYLYQTFDEELMARFTKRFNTSKDEILNNVYKQPLANRYLASYAIFLSENRGHYMIENIIEDGLNDFFFTHLYKFKESWKLPINFVGSVAFGFKDVLKELCNTYELELGKVLKAPMDGLVTFHK